MTSESRRIRHITTTRDDALSALRTDLLVWLTDLDESTLAYSPDGLTLRRLARRDAAQAFDGLQTFSGGLDATTGVFDELTSGSGIFDVVEATDKVVLQGDGAGLYMRSAGSLYPILRSDGFEVERGNFSLGFQAGAALWGLEAYSRNTLVGNYAGTNLQGNDNVMIGNYAGATMTTHEQSVIIGSMAASQVTAASRSVVIGFKAGINDTNVSDRLIIDDRERDLNQSEVFSLLYGAFGANVADQWLRVNGDLFARALQVVPIASPTLKSGFHALYPSAVDAHLRHKLVESAVTIERALAYTDAETWDANGATASLSLAGVGLYASFTVKRPLHARKASIFVHSLGASPTSVRLRLYDFAKTTILSDTVAAAPSSIGTLTLDLATPIDLVPGQQYWVGVVGNQAGTSLFAASSASAAALNATEANTTGIPRDPASIPTATTTNRPCVRLFA